MIVSFSHRMAPEVIVCESMKDKPYDFKADIWSLGMFWILFYNLREDRHVFFILFFCTDGIYYKNGTVFFHLILFLKRLC